MLVILTEQQLLQPEQVCYDCPLASQQGHPRWQAGRLGCGQALGKFSDGEPQQYRCAMGFRVANIRD